MLDIYSYIFIVVFGVAAIAAIVISVYKYIKEKDTPEWKEESKDAKWF